MLTVHMMIGSVEADLRNGSIQIRLETDPENRATKRFFVAACCFLRTDLTLAVILLLQLSPAAFGQIILRADKDLRRSAD